MSQNEYVFQVLMWAWSIIGFGMFVLALIGICEHAAQIFAFVLYAYQSIKMYLGVAFAVIRMRLDCIRGYQILTKGYSCMNKENFITEYVTRRLIW